MLIDTDDIVTISEIASEHGVSLAAVCNWRRRFASFPQPIKSVRGALGARPLMLFDRAAVKAWLRANNKPESPRRVRRHSTTEDR